MKENWTMKIVKKQATEAVVYPQVEATYAPMVAQVKDLCAQAEAAGMPEEYMMRIREEVHSVESAHKIAQITFRQQRDRIERMERQLAAVLAPLPERRS